MIVRFSKPTFPLSKYVESIYAYIGSSNDIARKLIPDGKTDLMLNFSSNLYFFDEKKKKQEITKSLIQGIRREPLTFIFGKNINIIGVRFLPLGFSKLLNIPDKELQYKNKPVYAKDVMGNLLSEIEEKIFEESDADKKILIIENWLLELFNERKPSDILITGAVQAITQRKGTISVKEVCDNSGGIYKKIQRTFHDYLGISPKLYSRMVRFESIHNELRTLKEVDWMSIVSKYNFYDQSHLIKEFKFFSGTSPEEFLSKIDLFV
jgi:AraC-like DNA-binding protein